MYTQQPPVMSTYWRKTKDKTVIRKKSNVNIHRINPGMFVGNRNGLSQRKHAQNPGDNQQVLVSCSMTINTNGQHSLVQ